MSTQRKVVAACEDCAPAEARISVVVSVFGLAEPAALRFAEDVRDALGVVAPIETDSESGSACHCVLFAEADDVDGRIDVFIERGEE